MRVRRRLGNINLHLHQVPQQRFEMRVAFAASAIGKIEFEIRRAGDRENGDHHLLPPGTSHHPRQRQVPVSFRVFRVMRTPS